MKKETYTFNELLGLSTVYAAVKHECELGLTSPTNEYAIAVQTYLTRVYKKENKILDYKNLNRCLGYDQGNNELIRELGVKYYARHKYLHELYFSLKEKYADNEEKILDEFNSIVAKIHKNRCKELERHVKISMTTTIDELDENGKEHKKRKTVYTVFKPTYLTDSLDAELDNNDDGCPLTLHYICSSKGRGSDPENEAIFKVTLAERLKTYNDSDKCIYSALASGLTNKEYEIMQFETKNVFDDFYTDYGVEINSNCNNKPLTIEQIGSKRFAIRQKEKEFWKNNSR